MRALTPVEAERDAPAARPPVPLVLLRALRPRQWTKNLAVFAPLLFARHVTDPVSALRATGAVLSFCLLASAIYLLNDWRDREADRQHPEKRLRPIAAGQMGGLAAVLLGTGLFAAGVGLAWLVRGQFLQVALAYVGLQVLYTLWLKRFVLLDVVVIAIGFVVRVVGGGVAIDVPVSNWLYLCTLLLAVFLGFAKRRHELSSLDQGAAAHRPVLSAYSLPLLDQLISVVASACILSYGLYSVSAETQAKVGSDRMKLTVPFVMYGIFRYLYLIHRKNQGGSPERVLLTDVPTLLTVAGFVAAAAWALYA
jgi:4-hydroxybenzoate polyprenyltransferase